MEARQLPNGTVTLLFTDIEGSTRLLQELGRETYVRALTAHRRLLRQAFAAHGGVEVEMQGDSFHFAFPYARDAVAAALAGHRALAEHTWESKPVRVRIGVHTGEPVQVDALYTGLDVHQAARVMSAAHGGQTLISGRTADLVVSELPDDVELLDLGEHRLRDVPVPQRLYQAGGGRFPPPSTEGPAAVADPATTAKLPRPLTSFVGREREQQELVELILSEEHRLLTLTGPGGTGKTRLALRAAEEAAHAFPAAVYWVELAAIRDPSLVMEVVAQALSARDGLASHIAEERLLVLLDNFEPVVEAAPELASLLQACPNLHVVVTSRELLRVQGEREYPVSPLARADAVELFCARSQLEPSREIGDLCARLDNLPLAIELGAARTRALSVQQVLERISQRLDLLKGGRDADPRQRTLRATIEWSYDLLSLEEQRLFRALSVFAGGCTVEAAEDVAQANVDALQSLVEKSLLRFADERYGMLETIRQHASERLEASADAARLRERHAQWFVALLETSEPELEGPAQGVWLNRLEAENDNVRAALRWALNENRGDLALRLASSSGVFWWVRGYWTEARGWLAQALTALGADDVRARSKALESAANLAFRQADYTEARRLAEEGLALATELGDLSRTARALRVLALATGGEGDEKGFRDLLERSATAARAAGDSWALVMALNNLGFWELNLGDPMSATELLEEAVELARSRGDKRSEAFVLGTLGFARASQRADAGRDDFAASLRLSHRLRFFEVATGGLLGLAVIHSEAGRHSDAARVVGGAQHVLDAIGADWDTLERRVHAELLRELEGQLGRDGLERALAEGHELSFDDLVDLALGAA